MRWSDRAIKMPLESGKRGPLRLSEFGVEYANINCRPDRGPYPETGGLIVYSPRPTVDDERLDRHIPLQTHAPFRDAAGGVVEGEQGGVGGELVAVAAEEPVGAGGNLLLLVGV